MKWYSVKKYSPTTNCGECLVATIDQDIWIATYNYYEDNDDYRSWIAETDGHPILNVTHFCIIDPVDKE